MLNFLEGFKFLASFPNFPYSELFCLHPKEVVLMGSQRTLKQDILLERVERRFEQKSLVTIKPGFERNLCRRKYNSSKIDFFMLAYCKIVHSGWFLFIFSLNINVFYCECYVFLIAKS